MTETVSSEPHTVSSDEMKVEMLSTTACKTLYQVSGDGNVHKFHVWAIVGGQLAISFSDNSFTERFNHWPIGKSENYLFEQKMYKGQETGVVPSTLDNPNGVQGPRIEDIEGGMHAFYRYYQGATAKRAIREERLKRLHEAAGGTYLRSKRMNHLGYRVYFHCTVDLECNGHVSRVWFDSPRETSVATMVEGIEEYIHPTWVRLMKLLAELNYKPSGYKMWEEIPEADFDGLVDLIKEIVESKQGTPSK